jgi:hypothetical protein
MFLLYLVSYIPSSRLSLLKNVDGCLLYVVCCWVMFVKSFVSSSSSGAISFSFGFFKKLFEALAEPVCFESLSFAIHHGSFAFCLGFLYLNEISDNDDYIEKKRNHSLKDKIN